MLCPAYEGVGAFLRSTFVKGRPAEDLAQKYEIGEELGAGATATVYHAKNKRTGQCVALKAMCKDKIQDETMLRNEISIHKVTDHPNILRLLEIFEDDKNLFLVTELCGAGDLWRLLQANQDEFSASMISEEEAFEILKQVLNSVGYLHSRGIVHRDLKPGNFLCCAPDSDAVDQKNVAGKIRIIKLADFGVSSCCHVKHRLTRKCGTDGFMAPEILRHQPYDEKADIFSVGCILHWLLTGHPPKAREDGSYVMSKIRLNFVSDEARALLEQLTRPNPEDRPSAEEVLRSPMLQGSAQRLRARSARLDAHLLDQMYAYGSFPLLKKAAIVAMVTRAESDADFAPSIERFMSLDRNLTSGIDTEDIYGALRDEMLDDMRKLVRKSIGGEVGRKRRGRSRLMPHGASRQPRDDAMKDTMKKFQTELHEDVARLVNKVDATGTGHISYSEWLAATADPAWYTDPLHISAAFRLFDFDGDGMISEEDLKCVIPDVFEKLTVKAVLQESQLSAKQTSWISEECFSLLIRTQNASVFTLQRICDGLEDPVAAADSGR
ncbi:CPK2 [Symbiodinium pilosum]|uniref:non-specific serine/threonine protein kinase n=1 Tax=Symbiodinium pilosum TaxID=2952 RepID=A0A812X454_SYMPI|nr:CPK2 [Symbiodinium pilosum]